MQVNKVCSKGEPMMGGNGDVTIENCNLLTDNYWPLNLNNAALFTNIFHHFNMNLEKDFDKYTPWYCLKSNLQFSLWYYPLQTQDIDWIFSS